MRLSLRALFLTLAISKLSFATITAQVGIGEKPYFTGIGVPVRVVIAGDDANPKPTWKLQQPLPEGVTFSLVSVSPQTSSRVVITNGRRIVDTQDTKYVFDFRLLSDNDKEITVGPIEFEQNGQTTSVGPFDFTFSEVPFDTDMVVEVEMPEGPFYLGQRVPLTIVWGYAGDLSRVRNLTISSPLFNEFEFRDEEISRDDTQVTILSNNDQTVVRADRKKGELDGRNYDLAIVNRIMVPTSPGQFRFDAVVADIDYVTQFRRSLFGDFDRRRAADVTPRRAKSGPFAFEILPLPGNAPVSFAGAIGTGFRINVDVVGSTIVNVGDPVQLKVTITGNGNLKEIGLPPLADSTGLQPNRFRVPTEKLAGVTKGNSKEFLTQIRVIDPTVNQIPSIEYSWFDPESGQYATTASEPRSITVGTTEVVSSSEVVSALTTSDNAENDSANPKPNLYAEQPRITDLSGADLAIEVDAKLLTNPVNSAPLILPLALYSIGIAVVGLAVVGQRRKKAMEKTDDLHSVLQSISKRILDAARSRDAKSLVAALRTALPHVDDSKRAAIDSLLADLETNIYAPQSDGGGTSSSATERATQVAKSIVS